VKEMALSIRNPRAEKLAREISAISGKNITQVIINALEDQIERLQSQWRYPDTVNEIMNISKRCKSIRDIDKRSPDEILGYSQTGVNE
jgi:antitoxin VapB